MRRVATAAEWNDEVLLMSRIQREPRRVGRFECLTGVQLTEWRSHRDCAESELRHGTVRRRASTLQCDRLSRLDSVGWADVANAIRSASVRT